MTFCISEVQFQSILYKINLHPRLKKKNHLESDQVYMMDIPTSRYTAVTESCFTQDPQTSGINLISFSSNFLKFIPSSGYELKVLCRCTKVFLKINLVEKDTKFLPTAGRSCIFITCLPTHHRLQKNFKRETNHLETTNALTGSNSCINLLFLRQRKPKGT